MSYAGTNPVDGPNDVGAPLVAATKPFRFKRRTLFLLAAGCVILLSALLGPLIVKARTAARAAQLRHSIHWVGIGLESYAYKNGSFPPPALLSDAGVPLSSWRFQITPHMGQFWGDAHEEGYEQQVPAWRPMAQWNDPIHKDAEAIVRGLFVWSGSDAAAFTNLFGVSGPDTAFDPTRAVAESDVPVDVVVAIEVVQSNIHWMQPGDYKVADLLAYRGKIGDHLHGLLADRLHVLFADGEVWALDASAPIADLQPFLTITGAKSHDRDQLLAPHKVD